MDQNGNKTTQKVVTGFVVVFAVVIIAVAVSALNKSGTSAPSTSTTPATSLGTSSSSTTASPNPSSTTTTTSGSYKDGSYTGSGSYRTPGGMEEISVTATIKSGAVTDVSLDQSANNRDSRAYQSDFEQEYKSYVVGKSVSSISLSGVAGASLTSDGFNNALEQIKSQAQS